MNNRFNEVKIEATFQEFLDSPAQVEFLETAADFPEWITYWTQPDQDFNPLSRIKITHTVPYGTILPFQEVTTDDLQYQTSKRYFYDAIESARRARNLPHLLTSLSVITNNPMPTYSNARRYEDNTPAFDAQAALWQVQRERAGPAQFDGYIADPFGIERNESEFDYGFYLN